MSTTHSAAATPPASGPAAARKSARSSGVTEATSRAALGGEGQDHRWSPTHGVATTSPGEASGSIPSRSAVAAATAVTNPVEPASAASAHRAPTTASSASAPVGARRRRVAAPAVTSATLPPARRQDPRDMPRAWPGRTVGGGSCDHAEVTGYGWRRITPGGMVLVAVLGVATSACSSGPSSAAAALRGSEVASPAPNVLIAVSGQVIRAGDGSGDPDLDRDARIGGRPSPTTARRRASKRNGRSSPIARRSGSHSEPLPRP